MVRLHVLYNVVLDNIHCTAQWAVVEAQAETKKSDQNNLKPTKRTWTQSFLSWQRLANPYPAQ